MEHPNAFLMESNDGDRFALIGCTDMDCECTTLEICKIGRRKVRRLDLHLDRESLEMLRNRIDGVLEFHDTKNLS